MNQIDEAIAKLWIAVSRLLEENRKLKKRLKDNDND
jgi:hypothetical protein